MALDIDNLPVDREAAATQAAQLLETDDFGTDAVLILAQLNPLALDSVGKPLYTDEQRSLIIEAHDLFQSWKD